MGETEKSHHLGAGNGPSCVNKYFPSDHVLDAKDTQMIMTKSLFKALCATYFLLQALTNGYGSTKAGIKKQTFKINCQELSWDHHTHHLLPMLHTEDSSGTSGQERRKAVTLAGPRPAAS